VSASFIIRVTVTVTGVTVREGGQGDLGKRGAKAGVQLLSNLSYAEFEFFVSNPATRFTTAFLSLPHPSPLHFLVLYNTYILTAPPPPPLPPPLGTQVWVGFVAMLWEKRSHVSKIAPNSSNQSPDSRKIFYISSGYAPPVHCGSSSASLAYLSNASRGCKRNISCVAKRG
jgi:hypothetical protein